MSGIRWYTYRTAARRTGRSIRTLREWRQAGMPAKVDPESRELLIAEPDLFAWWRKANRRNPRMRQRVHMQSQPTLGEADLWGGCSE